MKATRIVLRVSPDKDLETWEVIREGDKQPCATGLSKNKAVKVATRLVQRKARPATVLVHKTRYIIEACLQFSR